MKLYRVWYYCREIWMDPSAFAMAKFVESNDIGALVFYKNEQEKDMDDNPCIIGRYLKTISENEYFVFAENERDAIVSTRIELKEGIECGGDNNKSAIFLTGKVDIMEPTCELMNRHPRGFIICGDLLEDGNGELGDCWVGSPADPPLEDCEKRVWVEVKPKTVEI